MYKLAGDADSGKTVYIKILHAATSDHCISLQNNPRY